LSNIFIDNLLNVVSLKIAKIIEYNNYSTESIPLFEMDRRY
jgi:hypothetical protein